MIGRLHFLLVFHSWVFAVSINDMMEKHRESAVKEFGSLHCVSFFCKTENKNLSLEQAMCLAPWGHWRKTPMQLHLLRTSGDKNVHITKGKEETTLKQHKVRLSLNLDLFPISIFWIGKLKAWGLTGWLDNAHVFNFSTCDKTQHRVFFWGQWMRPFQMGVAMHLQRIPDSSSLSYTPVYTHQMLFIL